MESNIGKPLFTCEQCGRLGILSSAFFYSDRCVCGKCHSFLHSKKKEQITQITTKPILKGMFDESDD